MKRTVSGIIFDIKKCAIHDGPGIRTTVFLKGCPLSCWWCHNPEGRTVYLQKYVKFDKQVTVGREMTVKEVVEEIEKDVLFYDQSGGGVTFSGGEVFLQQNFLFTLLLACKKRDIHTCIDTTGYTDRENIEKVLPYTDLFYYDLKIMDDNTHKKFTGVSNRIIHENLSFLLGAGKEVIIRFPLIPGITDTESNIQALTEFLTTLGIGSLDILPYHRVATDKYKRLQVENKMDGVLPHSAEKIREIERFFTNNGFSVKIGG